MADQNFSGTLSVVGNVGIGTEPLPNAQLYIRSTTDQSQILVENLAGSLLKLSIDSSEIAIGTETGTTLPLSFHTNGQSRLSINSAGVVNASGSLTVQGALSVSGHVGIGTSTPSQTLEVVGTVRATAFQGDGSALTGVQVPDESIVTGKLANNSVTSNKLAANAVNTAQIANNSITFDKLGLSARNAFLSASGGTINGNLTIPAAQLSFGSQTRQIIDLWGGRYGIGVQSSTQYFRSDNSFCWFHGGVHSNTPSSPGIGGKRLMALNSSGDLILSARTNPNASSTESRCRALVDWNKQLVINYENDFSAGLRVDGTVSFTGNLGGFTTANTEEAGKLVWLRGNGWNEQLLKHSSRIGFFGRAGFGVHINASRDFGVWSDNWTPLLGVEGGSGNVQIRGQVRAARFIGPLQGPKIGYVVDQFINQIGETLEEGDVVILGHNQTSLYYGERHDVPIPEVDMTTSAYDTRVCGIVCQAYSKLKKGDDEADESTSFDSLTPEEQAEVDIAHVESGQIGLMVTLGTYAYCKVDADIASIQVGDLLTTSSTKGHAQKVLDRGQAIGAIIGKALGSLEKGKGKIPVIVILQ